MTAADIGDLNRHRYMSLATFRKSGAEVATPITANPAGYVLIEDEVVVGFDRGRIERLLLTPGLE